MDDALAAAKGRLREVLAAQRTGRRDASIAGDRVARALATRREVVGAGHVALYAALPDEVPTRPSFEVLREAGIARALPCPGPGGRLEFRQVEDWDELRPGRWNVLEPPPTAHVCALAEADVVLVPGVAFDRSGNRLGRGGGHYDATFPPGEAAPLLVGVAWEFQLVDAVPHGSRDRRVNAIVTERGWVWPAGGAR